MSKEETIEVTIRLPKNVVAALEEFVLKYDKKTLREWIEHEIPMSVAAEIDFIVDDQGIDDGYPMPTITKYGLNKYYDC